MDNQSEQPDEPLEKMRAIFPAAHRGKAGMIIIPTPPSPQADKIRRYVANQRITGGRFVEF